MAPFLCIVELIFAFYLSVCVIRSLIVRNSQWGWWVGLCFFTVLGMLIGAWLGFVFHYQPTDGMVVYSFPVPSAFLIREQQPNGTYQWTDFVTAAPLLSAIGNAFLTVALIFSPVWILNVVCHRRRQASTPPITA